MHPSFRFMGKKMDLAMVAWVALAWKGLDLAWGDPATGWEVLATGWGDLVTGWVDPDMVGMVEENAAPQRRSGEA